MFLQELARLGAAWPVWLAAAGVLIMLSLLVVIPLLRRPEGAALLARTLMKGATLQDRLLVGFRFVAIVPLLTLVPLLVALSIETAPDTQLPKVQRLAALISTTLPRLVHDHVAGIESLAGNVTAAQQFDSASLLESLLRHHAANQAFASLWIARPNGDVVVASAIEDGKAVPWSGPAAGVAAMDSFLQAVVAGELYVSSVNKGTAADAPPMMLISAPVAFDGNPRWGFIQGLLNVRAVVGGLLSEGTPDGVSAVVTDQRNRVILASRGLALLPFGDLSGHPLLTAAAKEEPGAPYTVTAALRTGGDSANFIVVGKLLDNGWRIFVAATRATAKTTLQLYMLIGLIWALLAFFLARGIAPLYAQVVVGPLQQLQASLDDFDADHTISVIPPPPKDAPQEILQTCARVRESMRSSSDAYRNMVKAVTKGAELRQQLRKANGISDADARPAKELGAAPQSSGFPGLALAKAPPGPDETWVAQLDSVTELSGLDVFQNYFSEAWLLGVADSRPMSVVLMRFGATDDSTLKLMAQRLTTEVGRTLDLIARIAAWEFAMILPDTDLSGALAVADKTRNVLRGGESGQSFAITFGVASIVPNANGNAPSFLDLCHRALASANPEGEGQIAFVNDKGKIVFYSRAVAEAAAKAFAEAASAADSESDAAGDDDFLIDWDPGDEVSA